MPPEIDETKLDGMSLDQLDAMAGGEADAPATPDPAAPAVETKPTPAVEPKATAPAPAPAVAVKDPAAAAPVPAEDDDDAAPADGKIPYQKYQRERKKAAERLALLERQLAETNDKFTRGDERLKLLSEALATPAQKEEDKDPAAEDQEPDPNSDLVAWANWSRRENVRLKQSIEQTREAVSQTNTTVRESTAETQMRETYQRDALAFAREKPDFGGAYNHLITARAAMLQEQGHNEQEIRTILHNEEKGLVERALRGNRRPAELVYNMAQQMGWRPPSAAPAPAAAPAVNGNGTAQPAAPAKPSVVEEIERIAKGQEASKSLSGTGGASSDLTVEALANMSERDFNALYAKKRGEVDALLGQRSH